MRLPDCASTPVRFPVTVGHRFDFTSRVTCWEARASNRATEICGLFFIANASACFKVRDIGIPGDGRALACWFELLCVELVCGIGAGGRLSAVCTLLDTWAKLNKCKARNSKNEMAYLCVGFMDSPLRRNWSGSSFVLLRNTFCFAPQHLPTPTALRLAILTAFRFAADNAHSHIRIIRQIKVHDVLGQADLDR